VAQVFEEFGVSPATYETFVGKVREINTFRAVESLLDWDQETFVPRRAAAHRAGQLALIAGFAHERLTSDELGNLLGALERDAQGGDPVRATNVRELRRQFDRAVKIPTKLVQEIAMASSLAKEAWAKARKASKFADFAPHLQKLLELRRQVADHVGWKSEPYDALMDEFEPGAKAADVQAVFDQVKAEVVPLVAAIKTAPQQPRREVLTRHCPQAQQAAFNRRLAEAMGFDFEAGRIDISTHPFCSGQTPTDVRMTTRYDEKYAPMSLFGTMHETGHGLYEQGLPVEHTGTPMANAVSLGIHESQSRLWENQIGRSRPFWEHFFPLLQREFPAMADVTLDDWHFAINTVAPSFIRVEADEVTYNLHIMLRFEIEREMIGGKLAVKDVPARWNALMQQYFGLTPPNDAEGCLQDIHWSMGAFGYFPTYALGNLYAAQFCETARKALPDLDGQLRRGDMRPLLGWLRTNIHQHGMRYRAAELVQVVTGRPLSHQPFVDYLKGKFRPLYGL
jgi:carboxypeptidase Taq